MIEYVETLSVQQIIALTFYKSRKSRRGTEWINREDISKDAMSVRRILDMKISTKSTKVSAACVTEKCKQE